MGSRRASILAGVLLTVMLLMASYIIPSHSDLGRTSLSSSSHSTPRKNRTTASISHLKATQILPPKPRGLERCWDQIGEQAVGRDGYFQKLEGTLESIVGRWYFVSDAKPPSSGVESPSEYFLRGLYRSGLLYGHDVEETEVHYDQALELFEKAHKLDPSNSAPSVFAALVEHRRGNVEEAEVWLNLVQQESSHFNSYVAQIAKVAYQIVESPSEILWAREVVGELATPDYNELGRFLKQHPAQAVGLQLVASAIDPDRVVDPIEYSPLEYGVGRALLEEIQGADAFPTLKDIWESKRQKNFMGESADKMVEARCKLSDWDSLVVKLRNHKFR